MRFQFKKGSKVEVFDTREVPSGSWRCGEIISGNGYTYLVRYDRYMSEMGDAMDRVPRKAIRPNPPMTSSRSWVSGDVLEVMENNSWKLAEVTMVIGGGYYTVRLLGSSREFRVNLLELRLRQSWQDGEWVVIGKDWEKPSDEMGNMPSKEWIFSHQRPQLCTKVNKCLRDEHFPITHTNSLKKAPWDFSGGKKKRRLGLSPPDGTCNGAGRKSRLVKKERSCRLQIARQAPEPQEKVDADVSPQTKLGEKYMHASLNYRTTGICEMRTGRGLPNANDEFYFVPLEEPSDTESTSSSVASCSTSNSRYRSTQPINGPIENMGSEYDDAETHIWSGSEPLPNQEEALAAEIHRLELHAYRTTLVALHASGPISWEQEALMTNLRLMLNISTDEHLLELRSLISVENNLPLR